MGYKEVSHTADWAILVWGKDIESFFFDAAQGMYSLMGIHADSSVKKNNSLTIQGDDLESLLVDFLSELLFIVENERSMYDEIKLVVEGNILKAQLTGHGILSFQKLIKAVTFHKLEISKPDDLFQAEIVFDV